MRDLTELDKYRDISPAVINHFGTAGDGSCGMFRVPSKFNGRTLTVIASSGENWDHVSVSLEKKPPSWLEMEQIKRMFFRDEEVAMQLHVTPDNHISVHDNCLHIWRPHDIEIPLPPKWMVG